MLKKLKKLKVFEFSKYFRFSIFTNSVVIRRAFRILHCILEILKIDIDFSIFEKVIIFENLKKLKNLKKIEISQNFQFFKIFEIFNFYKQCSDQKGRANLAFHTRASKN